MGSLDESGEITTNVKSDGPDAAEDLLELLLVMGRSMVQHITGWFEIRGMKREDVL
ncbi:MAG: hypothetical protein R6V19_06495 [Armatimonadota bacterium]